MEAVNSRAKNGRRSVSPSRQRKTHSYRKIEIEAPEACINLFTEKIETQEGKAPMQLLGSVFATLNPTYRTER